MIPLPPWRRKLFKNMNIKKNDTVKIISGNDRGMVAKVNEVLFSEGRVLVEGANLFKKHVKPRRDGEKGQIVTVPRPLALSKVMLVCPSCKQAIRVAHKMDGDKKVRYCRKCQAVI